VVPYSSKLFDDGVTAMLLADSAVTHSQPNNNIPCGVISQLKFGHASLSTVQSFEGMLAVAASLFMILMGMPSVVIPIGMLFLHSSWLQHRMPPEFHCNPVLANMALI